MRFKTYIACAAFLGSALLSNAGTWTGRADVAFTGSSTLHKFHGHGATEPFTATISEPDAAGASHINCRAVLNVRNLSTDDKSRDKNMYAMFHAVDFPVLEGALADVAIGATEVPLTISILGKEQSVVARASDWKESAGGYLFTLAFDVSLAKSGLQAPRVAGGLIKVADVIPVTVRVELSPAEAKP